MLETNQPTISPDCPHQVGTYTFVRWEFVEAQMGGFSFAVVAAARDTAPGL